MIIDLRSDTVTKPTKGMLDAILKAEVGDDVYKEDPTVNALEKKLATMFDMETALFFPSGSMANQAAIKLHTQPGDQVICDHYAHVYNYEGGGASFNSGVSCKLIAGSRGMFTAGDVEKSINPPDFYHSPRTSLVAVENTTNKGGGACWNLDELVKIKGIAKNNGLGYHLDGARIWNALVATGESPASFGSLFDSISVCLSKGLGCPMGSVLLGSKEFMQDAIRIRKILGGGMRQIGFVAAAGIYALDNHIERLSEDHRKAKELAEVLATKDFVSSIAPLETNILIFELHPEIDENQFTQQLKEQNILIIGMGGGKLRMVTHLDYTDEMHVKVLDVLKNL